jgi:arylsulfatase A-like enzyme
LGYMRHVDGHEHYPKEGIYRGTKEVYQNRKNITPQLDKSYTADLWTAGAKQWIIDHEQGENKQDPFFMFLAYDTPHAVLELPTQAYPKGSGLKGGLQWTGQPGEMITTASGKPDSWTHTDYAEATWDHDQNPDSPEVAWPAVYKRYATANRRIDSGVGDIMQLLEDLNIASNTLVVFTSDNGPSRESYLPEEYQPNKPTFFESYGPFDGIKRGTWEGGVRMPTLAMWPDRIPSNSEVDDPSINYDWLATFADAAGLAPPANSDGISLIPSLTGQGTQQERPLYIEYSVCGKTPAYEDFLEERQGRKRGQMQVLRMGDRVGVRYDVQSEEDDFEIYNVLDDPEQERNLAAGTESDSENSSDISALQEQMKEQVLQMRMPNETAPRPYDEALIPYVNKEQLTSGVQWKSYQNNTPWVPQVAKLTPADSGYVNRPNASVGAPEDGAINVTGYIRAPEDGEYTFSLTADEGAVLRLHRAAVIDADYGYEGGTERTGIVQLQAGLHPFHLTYIKSGNANPLLNLEWSGPGISKQAVPEDAFFRE